MTLQTDKSSNRVHFANDIMTNKMQLKGGQHIRYNLNIWKKNCAFNILNDIIENVTLVQLMGTLGNVDSAISIICSWIFDSNYEKSLCLKK